MTLCLIIVMSVVVFWHVAPPTANAQTRVGALTLNTGEDRLRSAVIDTVNGFAYFGTDTSPGRVVKVRLSDFARVGILTLNPGESYLYSAVVDSSGGFAYFGTGTSPGAIVKVRLSDFSRVGALTLNTGENTLRSAVVDSSGGFAYFGTDTSPGIVVKVKLSDFTRVGGLTLNTGEDDLYSAVIDSSGGFAYFGTDTYPGRVVKVNVAAEKGTTRIVLDASPKPGIVNKPVTISGTLYGSWRRIRDGMVINTPVTVSTDWGFSTVLTTNYYGQFSVETNCPSTGALNATRTYQITATFYEDEDLTGTSTTISYEVIAKILTTITISYVAFRQFAGYLRRADTGWGEYLAYKPVKLTVHYFSGTTWQTATFNLQTRHDGYYSLEFLFYWNWATISFEGDETYASSQATITR